MESRLRFTLLCRNLCLLTSGIGMREGENRDDFVGYVGTSTKMHSFILCYPAH